MSTYDHQQGTVPGFRGRAAHRTRHAAANTIGVILGAIVVGALIALLFAATIQGPVATQAHRAGAHGRVATMHKLQAGAAGVAAATAPVSHGLSARVANELRLRSSHGVHMSGEFAPVPVAVQRPNHTARA